MCISIMKLQCALQRQLACIQIVGARIVLLYFALKKMRIMREDEDKEYENREEDEMRRSQGGHGMVKDLSSRM